MESMLFSLEALTDRATPGAGIQARAALYLEEYNQAALYLHKYSHPANDA
jgi:hypothetical protein